MPKVSVLGKTYNNEKYVSEAIQSVLCQTFSDFELIVTDDGSTDGNIEKIRQFNDPRLTLLLHQTNQGVVSAAATSWRHSSGKYIACLDTDDIWQAHMLELLVNYLDEHADVLGVFGLPKLIDADGNFMEQRWEEQGVGADRYQLLNMLFRRQRPFCTPAVLLRRSILEELGFFPAHFSQSNDTAQFIKILFQGPMVIIPDYVIHYRRHKDAQTMPSTACFNRTLFENFELLFPYIELIENAELLLKIFPEASEHPWPINDRLVSFHLAQLALTGDPCNVLFGLHLLHQLLGQDSMAEYLQTSCNFSYIDLQRLKETKRIFADSEVLNELESMREKLEASQNEVESLLAANEALVRSNRSGLSFS